MTWLLLESKMFASVAHDTDKQILYLRFRNGEVYRYFDFADEEYQSFLQAESKVATFWPTSAIASAMNAWRNYGRPD